MVSGSARASRTEALFLAGPKLQSKLSSPFLGQYGLTLAMVVAATAVAFAIEQLVGAPNLSLLFVLPVVFSAASFGWGPALSAAVLGVVVFDFFFVEPRFTLWIAAPTDAWALALLLVVAATVSAVAAQSRRREIAAQQAADQAHALQAFAHLVLQSPPEDEIVRAAADTLARMFNAPAVVFRAHDGRAEPVAVAKGAVLTDEDLEAARWSLSSGLATRAETYPFGQANFDFWPVLSHDHARSVLGVKFHDRRRERPADPESLIEPVAAYLAIALDRGG
jgi:K+-sensing histidine kinase KdpD